MPPIVVDCHSHVCNAEDIPIDGFLKRKLRAPSLLTGVFSGPLDLVAAGRAPGAEEAARPLVLFARRLHGIPLARPGPAHGRARRCHGGEALPAVRLRADRQRVPLR